MLGAALSCVADVYWLGGVRLGPELMGKPGHAWVGSWVGAWVDHGGGLYRGFLHRGDVRGLTTDAYSAAI